MIFLYILRSVASFRDLILKAILYTPSIVVQQLISCPVSGYQKIWTQFSKSHSENYPFYSIYSYLFSINLFYLKQFISCYFTGGLTPVLQILFRRLSSLLHLFQFIVHKSSATYQLPFSGGLTSGS